MPESEPDDQQNSDVKTLIGLAVAIVLVARDGVSSDGNEEKHRDLGLHRGRASQLRASRHLENVTASKAKPRRFRRGSFAQIVAHFAGCSVIFCTRQFTSSAAKTVFSSGQARPWIQPNSFSDLPSPPSQPITWPSKLILKMRNASAAKRYCGDPAFGGVMQTDQGAPGKNRDRFDVGPANPCHT